MKVAIVTQPLMANYGGILQNYALQQVLKQLGHEPVTIDWLPTTPLKWYLRGLLRMIVKGVPYRRLFCVRSEPFETFVRSRLNLTPTVRCYRKSLVKDMDALLAGSDQVWRPGYSPRLLPDMFFRFAGDFRGIRMSYAASFGTDHWEASPSLKAQCLRYAKAILKGIAYAGGCGAGYDNMSVTGYKTITLEGLDAAGICITPETYFPMLESMRIIGGDAMLSPAVSESE